MRSFPTTQRLHRLKFTLVNKSLSQHSVVAVRYDAIFSFCTHAHTKPRSQVKYHAHWSGNDTKRNRELTTHAAGTYGGPGVHFDVASAAGPPMFRIVSALCPHYSRSLSAPFPQHLRNLSALFPRYFRSLSAPFPQPFRIVSAALGSFLQVLAIDHRQ